MYEVKLVSNPETDRDSSYSMGHEDLILNHNMMNNVLNLLLFIKLINNEFESDISKLNQIWLLLYKTD